MWEVGSDGTGWGLCSTVGFGKSSVEQSGSVTIVSETDGTGWGLPMFNSGLWQ